MKRKLTDLTVARLRPPDQGRLEVWDELLPGFGLRITARGARSWVVALRKRGARHPTRIKIGTPDEPERMSLADARNRAREVMSAPGALHMRRGQVDTVARVVSEYIERHQRPNNRAWREVERVLKRELAPWADWPLRNVTRHDVIELLDAIADRGAPYMANRTLAYLRKLFSWAVERDIVAASPVAGIRAPAAESSRDRVLDPVELGAIWKACEQLGWPFRDLIRLLMVTAQRIGEVQHMRWADLDLEARLWRLPAAATKAKRVHDVQLSPLALRIIASLPRVGAGYVFPARKAGSPNPVSGFSRVKARLDELSGVTGWRYHDLRRTAASGMARLGHPPHVVGRILNHSPGATQGVTAIYNRHAYADERRAALEDWAREIERIIA